MAGTHVALLRGINVGKAKRVAMADLRALVEGLGYGDVRTLLNSGNIVFAAPGVAAGDAAARIEEGISAKLGVASRVTVLTAAEVAATVAGNPWQDRDFDPSRLLVAVITDPVHRARLEPLLREDWGTDAFALGTRVAYLWCAGGILDSKLQVAVGRALKDGVTSRNWATLLKLQALLTNP